MVPNRPKHSNDVIDEWIGESAPWRPALICVRETERYAGAWCRARPEIEQTARSMQKKCVNNPSLR